MTPITLLAAVLQYGPSIIGVVAKLHGDIAAGRGNQEVTKADFDELVRLSNQSAEDIYKRIGVTPPPAAP